MEYELWFGKNADVLIKTRADKVEKSKCFPTGMNWAVIGLVREIGRDEYDEKKRVDNTPHKGIIGVHAHNFIRKDKKGNPIITYLDIHTPEDGMGYILAFLECHYAHLMA